MKVKKKNFNIKANQIFQQQISLLRNNFMHYFRLKERFAEKNLIFRGKK